MKPVSAQGVRQVVRMGDLGLDLLEEYFGRIYWESRYKYTPVRIASIEVVTIGKYLKK